MSRPNVRHYPRPRKSIAIFLGGFLGSIIASSIYRAALLLPLHVELPESSRYVSGLATFVLVFILLAFLGTAPFVIYAIGSKWDAPQPTTYEWLCAIGGLIGFGGLTGLLFASLIGLSLTMIGWIAWIALWTLGDGVEWKLELAPLWLGAIPGLIFGFLVSSSMWIVEMIAKDIKRCSSPGGYYFSQVASSALVSAYIAGAAGLLLGNLGVEAIEQPFVLIVGIIGGAALGREGWEAVVLHEESAS